MSCTYCGSKKHFVSSCPWISKNKTQRENMTIQEAMIEIDSLKQQIKYQEYREGSIGAHSPHCYTFGPHHYECALRKIEELESEADKFAEVIIKEFSTEGERNEIISFT